MGGLTRFLAAAVAALACMAAGAQAPRVIDLQAHRGARGLTPENTLPSFAQSLGIGVSTLELDIAITRDRVPVISHDPLLNPDITRGPGGHFLATPGPAVVDLTWEDLRRYDVGRLKPGTGYARTFSQQQPIDGTRIPRLADLFELVRRSGNTEVQFAIETKVTPLRPHETLPPEEFTRIVLDTIRAAGLERRVSILSFDWRTLQLVQKLAPGVPTVYLTIQRGASRNVQPGSPWTAGFDIRDHGSVPRLVKAAGGHTWSSFWRDLDAASVQEAQSLGLKVLAWTVNEPADMNRMLDLGVDGVVTDRPDLLRAELVRRGWPVPKATPVSFN
ncbi:MAG TPA: glycerophosphodiester phosphodiesterase [Ramlibacter sp.]|nr:glycerophosphodiester phosphodiesterase [Ramlibacter sp.]